MVFDIKTDAHRGKSAGLASTIAKEALRCQVVQRTSLCRIG